MDILAPQLIWIENRCYRINPTLENKDIAIPNDNDGCGYIEEDLYYDIEEEQENYEIEVTQDNRFKSTFHVPSLFFAQIIGSKGTTRKRLENETKAQIKIPKQGVEGPIVITATSRASVMAARRRVEIIVMAARNKQQFTHFLSIPIHNEEIKRSFMQFKEEILKGPPIVGLDESMFQNTDKLHITLGTLSLMDNQDRAWAAQLLQDCNENIIAKYSKSPIMFQIIGIEYMNDDPGAVDVLYAKVESEILQSMANEIVNFFISQGLMSKKYDYVKLHVTLINSLFRDETIEENSSRKRSTFDATRILTEFKNYKFGNQIIKEIHLSQRYSTACNGFYEATGIVKL